ncbi:hypothetical protein [Propioniciclava sinopodophylli]|uniref:hypothetical protein n=1 Tax=Propioniciclava sinopodophylli TaxID=1837344 RepID=UPI0024905438|nr:hypothetical protein [Propioniciclava sinopodophylli]
MTFDQRSWQSAAAEGAHEVEAWLAQTPNAWLNSLRRPDIDQSFRDKVFVVVGEAGSGKSTLMDVITDRESAAGNFPVYFDFKNSPLMVGKTETEAIIGALYQTMRRRIHRSLEDVGQLSALRAARIRHAVINFDTDPFVKLRADYPGIQEFSEPELLACVEAEELALRYEAENSRSFLTLMAAQYLSTHVRTTFLIDNVEGLSARSRLLLFDILNAVHTAKTLVVVAIRSEHVRETARLPQGKPGDPYVLAHDRSSFMSIARIRNDGALLYARENFEADDLGRAERLHADFESSLQVVEQNPYLYALFTGWLNENVRDFLGLLADISSVLPQLKGRSVNGYISTRLLEKHAHPSLSRIFDAKRQYTTRYKDLPFVFLPLRVLAYLNCRNSSVRMDDMVYDFQESFGISEGSLRRAVEMLSADETGKPYLVRVEEFDDTERIHLVRCGETFIRQVVFQCDYLQTLYDQVEHPPHIRDGLGYSELKLRRSLAVVENLIIPGFMDEHPYVSKKRATNRMRARLAAYEQMFSYKAGHWFIGALRRSLTTYAKDRQAAGVELSVVAAPTVAKLHAMEDRLDAVARGAR